MSELDPQVRVRCSIAAKLTGVSAATLRAWERRYGVPKPARSGTKYRLYDESDLAEIRAMKSLFEQYMTPQQAATVVASRREATKERMSPEPLPEASPEHMRLEGALRASWEHLTPQHAIGLTALVRSLVPS